MTAIATEVLNHILDQIRADADETRPDGFTLAALSKASGVEWIKRTEESARKFIPRLVACSSKLINRVEQVLNSPRLSRMIARQIHERLEHATPQDIAAETATELKRLSESLNSYLAVESVLLANISGEMVGDIVADFLCEEFSRQFKRNNRSTYPDLYFADADYTMLSKRTKQDTHLPALRGGHPSGVPDGVEIKSKRTNKMGEKVSADCHYHYQGMHLALAFYYSVAEKKWIVDDVYLAYLAFPDYTKSGRNAEATTVKHSFKHRPFISVTKRKQPEETKQTSNELLPFQEPLDVES
ncbi:MAG: hypothetical protein K1Y36_20385 [Blastocatellia bacterium]|nr:hypothetical protein [Blastocatellia bacterium]